MFSFRQKTVFQWAKGETVSTSDRLAANKPQRATLRQDTCLKTARLIKRRINDRLIDGRSAGEAERQCRVWCAWERGCRSFAVCALSSSWGGVDLLRVWQQTRNLDCADLIRWTWWKTTTPQSHKSIILPASAAQERARTLTRTHDWFWRLFKNFAYLCISKITHIHYHVI